MKKLLFPFLVISIIAAFTSCDSDKISEESLYVFNDKLMGQFIESDTTMSEFSKLLDKTKYKGLLNSYGEYTCFLPDNKAMRDYYASKGKKSLDDFSADSLKLIAQDHIINGAIINYIQFNEGRLFQLTMSDRFLTITFQGFDAFVNKTSKIIAKDMLVYNGIVHKIDKVLDPVRTGIAEVVSKDTTFSLFYSALVETGMVDSLLKTIDENYTMTSARARELEDAVNTTITSTRVAPWTRKYGYTLLMESNSTFAKNNVHNLADMKKLAAEIYDEVYPEDAGVTNITDRRNSFNRFISYHLINKELSNTKFVKDYDGLHMSRVIDMDEFIETMCPNTLLEVKVKRSSGEYNLFNYNKLTNKAVRLVIGNFDNDAANGVYHEIDGILSYNKDVDAELASKRLRFDFAALLPELTNNNMRGRLSDNNALFRNAIPPGYFDRLKCNDQVVICYSSPNDKLMNYQGDEFFIAVPAGKLYDFVVTTPPVPSGTYEVRFGYQSNGRRGVAQFYVDGVPAGVPVNLNNGGSHVGIGYVTPGTEPDDVDGYQNDKMMRNRGYMKGPNSFKAINEAWYAGVSARYNGSNLRKILGTYSFSKMENHQIMVKGLSSGQFQIDFIEFVPTSVLESEDVN